MAPYPVPDHDTRALARVAAAMAGGALTDPASRALAALIEEKFPGTREVVRAARRFHRTEARRAVEKGGVRGVVFVQAGMPTGPDYLHGEAALASPAARFLYADRDKVVTLMRRARCGRQCAAVSAGIDDPGAVLAAAAATGLPQPLQVHLVHALTWWPDEDAGQLVAAWAQQLTPGSSVALSVSVGGPAGRPGDLLRHLADVQPHTAVAVRSWLEDAGLLVAEPGVADVRTWPAAPAGGIREVPGWLVAGAVAVRRLRGADHVQDGTVRVAAALPVRGRAAAATVR